MGLTRDITNPTPGLLGLGLEGWIGTRADQLDGGARLSAGIPAVGLQAGLEYSVQADRVDVALSVNQAVRRGGWLLPGASLRVDWVPARTEVLVALSTPFGQHAGRTRPRTIEVAPVAAPRYLPPDPPADDTFAALTAELRERGRWITRLTQVPLAEGAPERSRPEFEAIARHLATAPRMVPGGNGASEVAAYHALVGRAFAHVLGSAEMAAIAADTARRILLDEVLAPYDRDFGQLRRPAVLRALMQQAGTSFERWLAGSGVAPDSRRAGAANVFVEMLAVARESADSLRATWGDSRLVWLPLQLALRAEEHDTQSELDALLQRLTGRPFLDGHDLDIATDQRFDPALRRSILDARDYHVLWIHDFAGRDPSGRPDTVSEGVVLEAYFVALEAAARAYDRVGKIPTFLVLLDRYYYRRSVADRWLELLADPLGTRFRLRPRWRATEARVREAQRRLRAAVTASSGLRAAEQRYGSRWLRRLISVHVSVTNPPDPTFRGPAIAGAAPGTFPDDVMRDHRKIAFADIGEDDPTRGVAILTGLGVGESYARFRWLDRTVVLRGPAAATLKEAARDLLRTQGFGEDEIPAELRPRAGAAGAASPRPPADWWARVAIVMNETGYGRKSASVAKAALYSLLPAGSTIVINDPQWLSRYWGGMLLGAALRGCKVLVIGPGPDNAPFGSAFVQRVLQRELFLRLIEAREVLQAPLAASGGRIETGLFRIGLGTYNVPGGVRAVRDGLRRYPFLREVLPFDQGVWDLFQQADSLLLALGEMSADSNATYHPSFHLKTQFMGTAAAMREAIGQPAWREFFIHRIRERLHEQPGGTDIVLGALAPLRPYLEARTPEVRDRQALYLTIGSHNQDVRSLMLDGEALCVVSGGAALLSAGDILLLATLDVDWLQSREALERSFPPYDDTRTQVARALENLF